MGTKCGGVVTVFLYLTIFAYFMVLWVKMYSTTQDIMNKQTKPNNFDPLEGKDRVLMKDYNFLPSIDLSNMDSSHANNDNYGVSDSKSEVDMDKVNTYVHFVLNVKIRKPTETKNVIKFFRPCRASDFTDHGIDMSD
jgi:hypothetical protein